MRGCLTDDFNANPVFSRGMRRCFPDYCANSSGELELALGRHENSCPSYIEEHRPHESRHSMRSYERSCRGLHTVVIRTTCKNGRLFTVVYLERDGYPRP